MKKIMDITDILANIFSAYLEHQSIDEGVDEILLVTSTDNKLHFSYLEALKEGVEILSEYSKQSKDLLKKLRWGLQKEYNQKDVLFMKKYFEKVLKTYEKKYSELQNES